MARKSTIAKISFVILIACILIFGDAIAPYPYQAQVREQPNAPASAVRFRDAAGNFRLRPFVYRSVLTDRLNFGYEDVIGQQFPVTILGRGSSYLIAGFIGACILIALGRAFSRRAA